MHGIKLDDGAIDEKCLKNSRNELNKNGVGNPKV
jgi:hypothetical protein